MEKINKKIRRLLGRRQLKIVKILTTEKEKTNLVMKVADKNGRSALLKVLNDKGLQYNGDRDKGAGDEREFFLGNEILFYSKIAKLYGRNLPIPGIYEWSLEDPIFLLTEWIEGKPLGISHKIEIKNLTKKQLEEMADFIFLLQSLKTAEIKTKAPEFKLLDGDANWEKYKRRFAERRHDLTEMLGKKTVKKMEKQLAEAKLLMAKAPKVFNNQEINGSNVFLRDDKLVFLDFDILRILANPAAAFSHLYTAFWPEPVLQGKFWQIVVKKGEKIYNNFREYLRLDVVFFRGSGVWWRYYRKKPAKRLVDFLNKQINR